MLHNLKRYFSWRKCVDSLKAAGICLNSAFLSKGVSKHLKQRRRVAERLGTNITSSQCPWIDYTWTQCHVLTNEPPCRQRLSDHLDELFGGLLRWDKMEVRGKAVGPETKNIVFDVDAVTVKVKPSTAGKILMSQRRSRTRTCIIRKRQETWKD